MAVTSLATFLNQMKAPRQRGHFMKTLNSTASNSQFSSWLLTPNAGAAPSTAAVPTSATTGALFPDPITNSSGGGLLNRLTNFDLQLMYTSVAITTASTGAGGGIAIWLLDRLSHQGGLVGNVATTQTTNLPTAALTRYTSGAGVMAALEVYSGFTGAGTVRATISYTNSAGTAARSSTTTVIGPGSTSVGNAGSFRIMPLASGDLGVRSVESVTLASALSSASNFGVTLFKPIALMCIGPHTTKGDPWTSGTLIAADSIADDACLMFTYANGSFAAGCALSGTLGIAEF